MTQRRLTPWPRGAKKVRKLRASPRVERLEERTLLTSSLVLVPSPQITGSGLNSAAAIAHNDIWAVGSEPGSTSSNLVPLAEHFNGTSWSVVSTPMLKQSSSFSGVAAVAGPRQQLVCLARPGEDRNQPRGDPQAGRRVATPSIP